MARAVSLGIGVFAQVALARRRRRGDAPPPAGTRQRRRLPPHAGLARARRDAPARSPAASAPARSSASFATTRPRCSITGATSRSRYWPGSAGAVPDHHFEVTRRSPTPRRSRCCSSASARAAAGSRAQFAKVEPLGTFDAPTGRRRNASIMPSGFTAGAGRCAPSEVASDAGQACSRPCASKPATASARSDAVATA